LAEGSKNIAFNIIKAIYSYVNSFAVKRLVLGAGLLVLGTLIVIGQTATITYNGNPFCTSVSPVAPTITILSGGPFSGESFSSIAGLTIDPSTGVITPGTSTPSSYTVTYNFIGQNGIPGTATTSVTINALPTATISYAGNPFCTSVASATPTINVISGGPFSATSFSSTAGLTIDPSTGVITPGTSNPGTYTVTYAFTGANGCPAVIGGVSGGEYEYRWPDNSSGRVLSNIPEGWYTLTVTDMNVCTVTDSVRLRGMNKMCLIIPGAISPNRDLVNDVWNIENIELYPKVEITIYNRWGQMLWKSDPGYPVPWNGRSRGEELPIDSYHYVIELHNGSKPLIGDVTIVR